VVNQLKFPTRLGKARTRDCLSECKA